MTAVLEVILYLAFADGDDIEKLEDICSWGTLLAKVIVFVLITSHIVVDSLYFCNIRSIAVDDPPTYESL